MDSGFEMLELREVHRFRGGSDAVVVPVEVVADRVNCAPDVHLRQGGHHDTKFEVALVTCLELFLTFAHLVLNSRNSHPRGTRVTRVRLAERDGRDN